MGGSLRFSICAFIVLSIFWTPAYSNDACTAGCKGAASEASFLTGNKYTYNVEGEVDIYLTGAENQKTSTKLAAQVSVTALGNCGHVLRVNSLQITGPDGKNYGKPLGIEKPVRFTLQDGQVGPEICTEDGEKQRSLNIKRAIISLLSSSKQTSEVDVFGVCPTESSSSREGGAVLVHRSRDLSRCAHREKGKHDLITSIYNPKAEIKSTNILQSTLNVESKVKNGIPEKVSSSEEYLYTPFSVGQNGARARVVTKLTLTGHSAGADTGVFKNSESIIFENPHPVNTEHNNQASVLSALKSTAQSLQGSAGPKSAGIFAQLVKIFRSTSKDDLLSVFSQIKAGGAVKDNNLIKKVFLDALFRTGTGDSVEVSIKLLQNGELSSFEQKLVFLSLGNTRHSSSSAVTAAANLLDKPNLPKEVYLGVGALGGIYCREHACHASTSLSPGIAALAQKFAAKVGNCKTKSKLEEDNLVAVLKGIRNIRHLEGSLIDKLAHCVTDAAVKARVKVAALEAFQADPCTAKLQKVAIDTMKNRQLDSEIRIKAYLVLLDCPTSRGATEIKNLLETEPVHQVGRFITSSLRFIRASANPDRDLAKKHFGLIGTPQKFNIDDRKYSHFRELSYSIDSLGLGATAEQTVIFSQDSFIPRSASLNLTTEVFGHSFNVFELGVRQGNLDRVLEHFFGPKGYFKSNNPQEIYDEIVDKYEEYGKKFQEQVRGRRAVQQEIANFAKQVKGETVNFNDELDLDIVVKIFGTDAVFLSLGDDQGFSIDKIVEKLLKEADNGAKGLKHFSEELRSHVLFLDAELAYPTAIGLPLKLNLVGSATGRLELGGSLDIRQILRNPSDGKIDLKVIPSTNIEIAGTFIVDADVINTGLKVVSNLHTSTGGHFVAKVLDNGKGFDLQFGLPLEKQEIVSVSNELVFVSYEKGQQETEVALKFDKKTNEHNEYSGCFDQLSQAIGLTLCGELSVPFKLQGPEAGASFQRLAARYPLTGPSKLLIFLEKNDLKNYHIKGLLQDDGAKRKGFEIVLEAEGAKTRRRTALSGELVNSQEEKRVKVQFESPIKTASAELAFVNQRSELACFASAKYDNNEYYGRLGFKVSGNEQRAIYTPVIETKFPGSEKKNLHVDGQVVRESQAPAKPGYKYSFNGININVPETNEKVQIDGYFANEVRGFSGELKAVKGDQRLNAKGTLDGPKVNLEFQNTLNPNINFKADLHSIREDGHYQNDLNVVYGSDLNSRTNKLILNQNFKYHYKSNKDFDVITKNLISLPALQFEIKADGEFDPKKVDVDFEAKYQGRKADLEIEARTEIKRPGDYNVKFEAGIDDKGFEIFAKRDILSDDKSNFENVLTVKPGVKYELSGVVLHRVKNQDINVGAVGHLIISGKNEDIKFDIGVISNANQYASHTKISTGPSELVNFLLKISKGVNPNGQLVLNLKDTVTANGQFKLTDSDGKGNGVLIIDFKKLGRKMKGDLNFVRKAPQYNANLDLFLDFEKDNNNKIHFNTASIIKEGHVDSKNELVVNGQKTVLTTKTDMNGDYKNGKINSVSELTLPSQRVLSYKLVRDVTNKDKVFNGHIDVSVSDAPTRGAAGSNFGYKAKIVNLKYEKTTPYFTYDGQLSINLNNGKNLAYAFTVKHSEGDSNVLDGKFDLNGNLIPKPVAVAGSLTYKVDDNRIDGNYKYQVKGNYGSDSNFVFSGNQDVQLLNSEDKKYDGETSLRLNLPFEKLRDVKLNTNVMFLVPKNKEVIVEYNLGGSAQINADIYKVDSTAKIGLNNGFEKIKVVIPHNDPFTLDTSYKSDVHGNKKSGGFEIKSTYGRGKSATIAVDAERASDSEYSLKVKASAPQAEKLKHLEITLLNKRPDPNTVSSHIVVDADGSIYKMDANAHNSRTDPLIDIKYSCPHSPKPSRIYVKGSNFNEFGGKLDLKIENVRDLDLASSFDVHRSNDAINVKVDADAPKFNLVKYHSEITTKDSNHGKRLEFLSTNNGKNFLSGSTSYVYKQDGSKTIVEGSGTVKLKEEQKSATFKYIRDVLSEGREQGIEEFINVAVGDRSVVWETRITNLEYKFSHVYCEEKKQCANAEFNSKINVATPGLLQHTVNIGLDLRKLGFSPEFGLQMSSEVAENKLPQYLLDVHLNQDQSKYHLHAYSQPKNGDFPSGIVLTLPKRVIALESHVTYPQGKAIPFPIKGEAAFYLDKNHQPRQKAAVRFLVDVTGDKAQHSAVADIGFSHPALNQEAVLKFKQVLVHPDLYTYKLDSAAIFSHPAFGSAKESKALFEISPKNVKLLLRVPLVEIVNVDGSANIESQSQLIDLTFTLLQGRPVDVHVFAQNYQKFEFTTGYRDQGGKLSIVGHIEPEKRIEFSTDLILGNEKKNIVRGALFVQDNLVKPDFAFSKDNFQYFANAVKNDITNLGQRLKQLEEQARANAKADFNRASSALEKVASSYKAELTKLKEEVLNDKTLQDVNKALNSVIVMFAKMIDDIITHTAPLVEKLNADIKDIMENVGALYNEKIAPQLKIMFENISELFKSVSNTVVDAVSHFAAIVQDFFEKHKAEFQELTNIFTEIVRDISRIVVAQLRDLRRNIENIYNAVLENVRNLPVFEMLKEKLSEFAVPDQVVEGLRQLTTVVSDILPTNEGKDFVKALFDYIQKRLRNVKVEDQAEYHLVEKFVAAFRSFGNYFRSQFSEKGFASIFNLNMFRFNPASPYSNFPGVGSFSFSPLNYLRNGEFPSPLDFLRAYRPRSLLPEFPAKLTGVVVNGQHIFTFDGRHLTFPGSCRYVLALDHGDSNFTIAVQLQNGSPKSIILTDKSGAVIEMKENGQVALNGANHGFPVRTKDSYAFKTPEGALGMGTNYGAMVLCSPKLTVCGIEVSGYYLGKLRGLLGDGNNEEYDDFRLPNGKIAANEADFGNAYRLATSCPQVKTPDHHHHGHGELSAACEKVFGGLSPLRPLFLLQDPQPYKQACAHATSANQANAQEEACDIGRAFVAKFKLPALLPSICVQCHDGSAVTAVGDSSKFKLPSKQADIVVAVELTKSNEQNYKDLVVPLISHVVDQLKQKKIDDVKVYLIGVTSEMPYPFVYDIENAKLKGGKPQFTENSRYNRLFKPITTRIEQVDKLLESFAKSVDLFQKEFVVYNIAQGYTQIGDVPFRSGAVKTVISLASETCTEASLPFQKINIALKSFFLRQNALTFNLITVTPVLKVGGGKQAAQVVGFDKNSVLILGDKKRGKDTEKLRETLEVFPDACIDLSEKSDGTVFSASNFAMLNPAQRKQFTQSAAHNIVDKLLREEIEQTCRCIQLDAYRARNICTIDSRKEVARRR